jgi:putative flippase GtrA
LAAIIITGIYAFIVYLNQAVPAAASFFGHMIGVIGFLLMLMTETLYSFRKRSRKGRWGSMQSWLQFHIFTGLVGPYMVLLHTSWKFNGLAGVTTLLTIFIVISGFIGRYIYTRVPRSLDGVEIGDPGVATRVALIANTRRTLSIWHAIHIPIGMALFVAAFIHIGAALTYATLLR